MNISDDTKNRIRLEEVFREEVRKELGCNIEKDSKKSSGLNSFLNSTFGNFVCTAVLVPCFIFLFTSVRGCQEDRRSLANRISELDNEIGYRLVTNWYHLDGSQGSVENFEAGLGGGRIYCYPQYRDREATGLMYELAQLVEDGDAEVIYKALDSISKKDRKIEEVKLGLKIRGWLKGKSEKGAK